MKRVSKIFLAIAIIVLALTMLVACSVKIGINFIVDGETYYDIRTKGQEEIEFPNPPTKEGYVFKGWFWDEDIWTQPFTIYSLVNQPLSDSINVYAYFITQEEADSLKVVRFNTMGAGELDPIEAKLGTRIEEPATLTRDGYIFVGWYLEADFTTKWNFRTDTVSSDMTLYAKWIEDIPENRLYTVSFNTNGGSSVNEIAEITYNSTISKPTNPVLDGYALVGWYTDNTYAKEWNFTLDTVRENITLYARWERADVSACSLVSAEGFDIDGKNLHIKVPNEQTTFSFIDKIEVSAFASWEIVNDLEGKDVVPSRTVEVAVGDNTKYILVTSYDGLHRNFYTVTVRRRPIYTVNLIHNNGTDDTVDAEYEEDSKITFPELILKGYTFTEWQDDAENVWDVENDTVQKDTTLNAIWTANDYTVTFDTDGGNAINEKQVTYDSDYEFEVPQKIGYNFVAWSLNDVVLTDNEGKSNSVWNIDEDTTVKAEYEVITYNITYENLKGANNTNVATYTIEDEVNFSALSQSGYIFDNWSDEDGEPIENIEKGNIGNRTITAEWTLIGYNAIFKADGNEVERVPFNVETADIQEPSIPDKRGYDAEWADYTLTAGDKIINAIYTPIVYTITYENVSGEYDIDTPVNNNPTTYTIESDTITLNAPSKTGYRFVKWTDDMDVEEVTEIPSGSLLHRTLIAHWVAIEYSVTYVDAPINSNVTTYTVESSDINLVAPQKTGYDFVNWTENGKAVDKIIQGSHEDKEITANWNVHIYTITYTNVSGEYDIDTPVNNNPTTYTIESDTITLNAPSKTGYTFVNWTAASGNAVTNVPSGSYGDKTIRANWTAITYTLTMIMENENGGYDGHYADEENRASFTVEDEFDFISPICDIRGYEFKGWYTTKNEEGEKFDGVARGTIGNKKYYAQWQARNYAVTYHNVENATNNNPEFYTVETATFTLNTPSKIGYTFAGWFKEDMTTAANITVSLGSVGDLNFYAKWDLTDYAITYVLYEGTNDVNNPTSYTFEDRIVLKNPTRAGYSFGGWYDNSDFKNKIEVIEEGSAGALSLYARWYWIATVTFDSHGGSAVASIKQEYNTKLNAPENPTRDYYNFVGWFENLTDTEPYEFTTMPYVDFTLHAKWSPVEYTITYILNDGINDKDNPTKYTVEDEITLKNASKIGYTFVAWYTDSRFTSAPVATIAQGSHGNMTLYANFSLNEYTITFDSNGGSAVNAITQDYNTVVQPPIEPTKNAYNFDGWYTANNVRYSFDRMPGYDFTLTARWSPVEYAINYGLGGGTNNKDNPLEYTVETNTITLKNPTKRGYNFQGWFTDTDYTTQVTQITRGSYGTVDVQAKWEVINYTITYVNTEDLANDNPITYTVEDEITFAPISKLGYSFHGLFTESNFKTAISGIEQGSIGDVTVYAKFTVNSYDVWMDGKSVSSYTVSFDVNGGVGEFASQTVMATNALTYPGAPTRKNHVFGGWYTNKDCNGDIYDFTAIVKDDITLYAKWIAVTGEVIDIGGSKTVSANGTELFTYSFVPLVSGDVSITTTGSVDTYGYLYDGENNLLATNDDDGDGDNFLIKYNATAGRLYTVKFRGYSKVSAGSITLSVSGNTEIADGGIASEPGGKVNVTFGTAFKLDVPSRTGYVFRGWADIDGVMYTDENGNSIKNFDKGEETVLYSQWEVDGFTITFVTNNGTAVSPVTLPRGARLDINQYVTTRNGYSFNGWYLSASDTESYNASVMPDYDITLYAKWKSYAINPIKYDTSIKYLSEFVTVTEDTFGATCFDTDGKLVPMTVAINGTQTSGNTVTVRYTATSNGKTRTATITDVKVYGMPTITIGQTKDYLNLKDSFNPTWFTATAVDVYGESVTPVISVDGEYSDGDIKTIIVSATDVSGNTATQRIENVKLYGLPVISYDTTLAGISSSYTLSSGAALGATAVDSFGNALTVITDLGSTTTPTVTDAEYTVSISGQTLRSYNFTATANGTVTIYTTGSIDTYGYLYYNGSSVASNDDGGDNANFKITYTVTKGRTYTVKVRGYSSSTNGTARLYIKGNMTSGSAALSGLSGKVGEKIRITFTATDSKGNAQTLVVDNVKVYGNPTVNNPTKTDFKVTDEITVESLGITATDTFGEAVNDIVITDISGTQTAGATRIVTVKATDGAKNVTTKQYTVKIYGGISLSYPDEIKASANLNKADFKITAKDSFGTDLAATVEYVSGQQVGGQTATYRISAADAAGNVRIDEKTFKVYALDDISLTYDPFSTDKIKLSSKGEEFGAEATDSFGDLCEISIEQSNGDAIVAGQEQTIVIVATDKAGNIYRSEAIANIRVYGMPTVTNTLTNDNGAYCKDSDDDIYFMFSATDSFGEEIYVDVQIVDGDVGGIFTARITVTDDANNVFTADYVVHNYYELTTTDNDANAGSYTKYSQQKVMVGKEVTLTATTNNGYTWLGWYDGETKVSEGTDLTYTFTMSAENKTYTAKWAYYTITTDTNLSGAGSYTRYSGYKVTAGNEVTLTASTNNGYTWLGWYDGETKVSEGTDLTYTFTMSAENKTYTAKWAYYTITTDTNLSGAGSYTRYSGYKVTAGNEVTLTASTNNGYTWLGWYDGEMKVSEGTDLTYTFEMIAENKTYTAKWELCTAHTLDENCICTKCGATDHKDMDTKGYCHHDNYIYFGYYPQTIKADDVTVGDTADSDGYYLGSDGERYAKVTATPYGSGYTYSTGASVTSGTVYYFKVEPIKWRILSESDGTAFILCDSIIANHCYYESTSTRTIDGKTVYANNYMYSSIRQWLNDEFYNKAFNSLQQELILITEVDNSAASTGYSSNRFACANTNDKVFLLSYAEVTNSAYGFSSSWATYDIARQMTTSDYSRATGACMNTSSDYYGRGGWRLRSPCCNYSWYVSVVNYGGNANNYSIDDYYSGGVVPALWIKLS